MFDSEYSTDTTDICKSIKRSIRTVIKNPEMLKFFPDLLKNKRMYKHSVKKITLSIKICS